MIQCIFFFTVQIEANYHNISIHVTFLVAVTLQFHHWSVWRFLCQRIQESIQNQGKKFNKEFLGQIQSQIIFFCTKDFGDIIPGHGGIMDRFDCQYLMATFVNVYISSFIRTYSPQKLLQQVSFFLTIFSKTMY